MQIRRSGITPNRPSRLAIFGRGSDRRGSRLPGSPFERLIDGCKLANARSRGEAVAAIHRLVSARLERHFGYSAALAAGGFEHLAAPRRGTATAATAGPAGFACRTALRATARLVREALGGVELLFAGGKWEGTAAVDARQRFILVHNESPKNSGV